MNGFRQQPAPSRKDQQRAMETELKNLQMALQVNQMLVRQLLQNNQNMSSDLGRALGLIGELQYKVLAVQKVANLDVASLKAVSDELRLKDFQEASDKEDADAKFTVGSVVTEDSTVIITSKTEGENDHGIFRSRIKLAETGSKDLIDGFMGREVGAKIITTLNGIEHEIELLAIRQPAPAAQEASALVSEAAQA